VIGLWNAIPATREEFDKSLVDIGIAAAAWSLRFRSPSRKRAG